MWMGIISLCIYIGNGEGKKAIPISRQTNAQKDIFGFKNDLEHTFKFSWLPIYSNWTILFGLSMIFTSGLLVMTWTWCHFLMWCSWFIDEPSCFCAQIVLLTTLLTYICRHLKWLNQRRSFQQLVISTLWQCTNGFSAMPFLDRSTRDDEIKGFTAILAT